MEWSAKSRQYYQFNAKKICVAYKITLAKYCPRRFPFVETTNIAIKWFVFLQSDLPSWDVIFLSSKICWPILFIFYNSWFNWFWPTLFLFVCESLCFIENGDIHSYLTCHQSRMASRSTLFFFFYKKFLDNFAVFF